MPVYPGTKSPRFIISNTFEADGFRELFCQFQTHTGTHLDTPAHILENGSTLSDLPVDAFTGKAVLFPLNTENPLRLRNIEKQLDKLKGIDFILFNTGWDRYWGTEAYFKNFPVPDQSILERLLQFNIKGFGIDAISVDPINSKELPNHHTILTGNCIIIENLTNLNTLKNKEFEIYCFPLKIDQSDGSPVRAVARILE